MSWSDRYRQLREASYEFDERKDCGVVTIAALTNEPYVKARQSLAYRGRKPRKATPYDALITTLEERGFNIKRRDVKSRTVRTIERELTKGKFMVFTTRRTHVLALVDGVVHDWSRGRRNRIHSVFEIT